MGYFSNSPENNRIDFDGLSCLLLLYCLSFYRFANHLLTYSLPFLSEALRVPMTENLELLSERLAGGDFTC